MCNILSLAYFFSGFLAFKQANLNLNELDVFTGKIIDKGIINNSSSISGRGSFNSKVFFIKLDGLNQILAFYNQKKNYENLDKNLNIGDTVRVYFKMSKITARPNLETFQIEKKKAIILNKNECQFREKMVGYIAIMGGFAMIGIAFYQDKKYWKKN